ncbi:MAG: SIS domain-containing protein [Eubacteriaceae bacterium]|nr:SIS domain-containing protein [Eubacteriaceae bacterium]
MIKFNESQRRESIQGALALRGEIENISDKIWKEDFKEIFFMGIGGTLASAMQTATHCQMNCNLPVYTLSAGEYSAGGNMRVGEGSVVVFSSVSGTTPEIISAVERAKQAGAKIWAFLDDPKVPLAEMVHWRVSYPENEQLKLFMAADRLMYNAGQFPEYAEYNAKMERHFADTAVNAEYMGDGFARKWAEEHCRDDMHYFIGEGANWGAIYSFAMCYLEEQHWMRTKSIHAAEFFHGTLEIIEENTPVTLYMGEDAQRSLAQRVADFLPKVNGNHTIIDSAAYPSPGLEKFRSRISHHILRAVNNRIDAHIEDITGHDREIRRYYRKMDY